MTAGFATESVRHAVHLALLVAAPLLLATLIVGVVVSLVQAVTQLQEQTLTFLPKLAVLAAVFLFTLPWMLQRMVEYLAYVLRTLPMVAS